MNKNLIIKVSLLVGNLCSFQVLATGPEKQEPILPIPQSHSIESRRVELGSKLFNDSRLSKGNILSCASCHQLAQGGDDGLVVSITNTGEPDIINAPSVFNSRFNFRQTWSGKFRTLEEQAEGDIRNPRHGNTDWDDLLPKLRADAAYKKSFFQIYQKDIDRESVLDAIASYERSLITPDSRFDRYLNGEDDVLTSDEREGYRLFKAKGCIACHQGVNVGGNVFQEFGLFGNYFESKKMLTEADFGLYNVTGREEDKHIFRVPSLRNIAVTAPYLHDGSIVKLEEVVKVMSRYQLGAEIKDKEARLITAFLRTLTGKYQGRLLEE